jgi:hypothetical protein
MLCLVLCGLFYHHVSDDIGGFQNRLGEHPLGPEWDVLG